MIFFSEMLSTLRKRDGYSQQELADKLKVSRSAISMYECGEREPDFKTIEAIVNLFQVDVSELLFGKSPSCESCRICGHDLPVNSKFCPECGRAFRPWDSSKVREQTEMDLRTLEGLLHYHERMMMVDVLPVCSNNVDGRCATKVFLDPYADAIKEAIRCIRICHGID